MIIFIGIFMVYLILLIFPFLLAKGIRYDSEMEKSLVVKNDNIKDARYFSKSFRRLMKNVENVRESDEKDDGQSSAIERARLSKDEEIFFWNGTESLGNQVNSICYINRETVFCNKIIFKKEVFAKKNIEFAEKTRIRAIAGNENVIIGKSSKIGRWADAEHLLVLKRGSNAGKSISAGERLVIEPDCVFTRLYAPVIQAKEYIRVVDKDEEVVINEDAPVYMKIKRNLKRVEQNEEIRNTIITKHNLTIETGAIVYGDIKSDKMVHVKKNVIVTGNVFGDASVIIEQGAKVMGNVFAGNNLYIGPDVTIGIIGRIKSAISRVNIVIAESATIYGYAGCENRGKIIRRDEFRKEVAVVENKDIEV